MTLNNPPDQPSVEQITNKNNFSYTSHAHHPLTGTPFSENNTAIPTTPATPTTLATGDHPAANLAQLTCNPRYSHYSRYSYYWGPFRLKLSPSTHHPRAQYSDSIVTLRCAQGLSPWAERSFAAAQHDSAIPYYCPLAIEPYWRHVPVYDTLNNSLKYIKASSTMMPSPDCRILSTGEIWEEFCNSTEAIVPYKQRQSLCCLSFTGFAYIAFPPEMQYTQNL